MLFPPFLPLLHCFLDGSHIHRVVIRSIQSVSRNRLRYLYSKILAGPFLQCRLCGGDDAQVGIIQQSDKDRECSSSFQFGQVLHTQQTNVRIGINQLRAR